MRQRTRGRVRGRIVLRDIPALVVAVFRGTLFSEGSDSLDVVLRCKRYGFAGGGHLNGRFQVKFQPLIKHQLGKADRDGRAGGNSLRHGQGS